MIPDEPGFFIRLPPGISIHIAPESLFTSPRNDYSHAPESARDHMNEKQDGSDSQPQKGGDSKIKRRAFIGALGTGTANSREFVR